MKSTQYFILVTVILCISLILRVVVLGSNPTILNRDEAALAYNALLLAQTGMDEWREPWPLTLQSFGDYKLIGYPALLTIFFKFFSYSDFIVRLPSALAGVGVLLCVYLLVKQFTDSEQVAVYTLAVAAFTPVFFFYSRMAFEANLGLVLFLCYLILALRRVDGKTVWYDILALICVLFAVVTYNTPLLLVPFITLLLPFIRGFRSIQKWGLLVLGSVIIFGFFFKTFAQLTAQKQAITIFSDPTSYHYFIEYRNQLSGLAQKLFGNKYVFYFFQMIPRFVKSFSLDFLVTRGGQHPWHSLPGWSHLLITQYLAVAGGLLYCLIQVVFRLRKISLKNLKHQVAESLMNSSFGKIFILLYLLVISLAPSIVTVDSPHATRSLFFMVLLFVISGYAISKLPLKARTTQIVLGGILLGSLGLFTGYLWDYFVNYPVQQRVLLQSGYKTVLSEVSQKYPKEKIAVVDEQGYQYIVTAWYLHMEPSKFHESVIMQNPDQIGFRYGQQVGNYHFVKAAADRSQDEQVIVEWNKAAHEWQVRESR